MMAVYARRERPDLARINEGCPPALLAAVEQCWQHDPAARPAFARLAADLEAAAHEATARPPAGLRADGSHYDVFLSHRQADTQDFVRHLYDLLTEQGYRVFLDRVDASKVNALVCAEKKRTLGGGGVR